MVGNQYRGSRRGRYPRRTYNKDRNESASFNGIFGSSSSNQVLSGFQTAEEKQRDHIVSLLFKIGNNTGNTPLHSQIDLVASQLAKEYTLYKNSFLDAFQLCVTQISTRTNVYAVILGLMNASNFDIGKDVVSMVVTSLNKALEDNHLRSAKLLVRFLCLSAAANVITATELVGLLNTLLSVTMEASVKQERSDAFVFLVLSNLPFVAAHLRDSVPEELKRIINGLTDYFSLRQANLATVQLAMEATAVYRSDLSAEDEFPYRRVDRLTLLWLQTQNMQEKQFEVPLLPNLVADFEAVVSQQLQHELPPVRIPSTVTAVRFDYQPMFCIFDDAINDPLSDSRIAHLPLLTDIHRFLLSDIVTDVIRVFSLNHTEATRILLHLDGCIDTTYLAANNYKFSEAMVEAIFCELLRFPKSQERFVYYATLIIDLCKEALDIIPSIFGRSIKTLFSRLDKPNSEGCDGMDVEAIRRLSDLFALHLSNFQYLWKWADWADAIADVSPHSGQFVFVRETLQTCLRLSYWDRIRGVLPESLQDKDSVFPTTAPTYCFKFETPVTAGDPTLFKLASELTELIENRVDVAQVELLLSRIERYASGQSLGDEEMQQGDEDSQMKDSKPFSIKSDAAPESVAREVLLHCIMLQGSKSFSHILDVVERHHTLLQSYNSNLESRLHTIEIIADFWKLNTQFVEITLDKLTNYRILDPKSVLVWVIHSRVMDTQFDRFYVWSIIRNTLVKVNLKVEQIDYKLAKLKRTGGTNALASTDMNTDAADGKNDVDALESSRESALREKKETFLLVLQKFVDLITQKLHTNDAKQIDTVATPWWRWVVGFFRELGRSFRDDVEQLKFTLDAVVFSDDVEPRVLAIWNSLKAVYELHQIDTA